MTPPQVKGVLLIDDKTVLVVFSEPIDLDACVQDKCIQINNLKDWLWPFDGDLSAYGGVGVVFKTTQTMYFYYDANVAGSGDYVVTVFGKDQQPNSAVRDAAGNRLATTFKKNLSEAHY
jgi:hypothetical protein